MRVLKGKILWRGSVSPDGLTVSVSYVDLTVGGFNQGTYWRALYDTNQTVIVAGQTITFRNTRPTGIQPARLVAGIGSTC